MIVGSLCVQGVVAAACVCVWPNVMYDSTGAGPGPGPDELAALVTTTATGVWMLLFDVDEGVQAK